MRLRIHPLCPVMLLGAVLLGEGLRMSVLMVSVTLHELGHIGAAYLLRVPVAELELMPCGGAARFDNVWQMRPGVLCAVALCGPLTNALLACVSAALGWWGVLNGQMTALLIGCNLALMAFNLMPALPLDGGRILCSLLTRRLPPRRAVKLGVRLGQSLGAMLVALGCALAARGRFNLTFILCGAYLLLSAPSEMQRLTSAALCSLMARTKELARLRVLPVRMLAVPPDIHPGELTARMLPGAVYRFLVVDEKGGTRVMEEQELRRGLEQRIPE